MENHQLSSDNPMILEIRELLEKSRKNIAQQVNTELLTTYWNIGGLLWSMSSKASFAQSMESRP